MARQKSYSRDEVVASALSAFNQSGYFATSISALVEATSLNRKILYELFGSKEGLLSEALTLYCQGQLQTWNDRLGGGTKGKAQIQGFMHSFGLASAQAGDLASMILNEGERAPEPALQVCRDHLGQLEALLAENLIADGVKVEAAATVAQALVLQLSALTTMGKMNSDEQSITRFINTSVGSLLA